MAIIVGVGYIAVRMLSRADDPNLPDVVLPDGRKGIAVDCAFNKVECAVEVGKRCPKGYDEVKAPNFIAVVCK